MQKIIVILTGVFGFLIPSLKSPSSKVGVKETKEAVVGLNEVSLVLAKQFKDGVQLQDFSEIYLKIVNDQAFKEKVQSAYENYKLIPDEIEDADAGEALELAQAQLEYLPKYLEVFSKEKVA